jgi:hypothetical protein
MLFQPGRKLVIEFSQIRTGALPDRLRHESTKETCMDL